MYAVPDNQRCWLSARQQWLCRGCYHIKTIINGMTVSSRKVGSRYRMQDSAKRMLPLLKASGANIPEGDGETLSRVNGMSVIRRVNQVHPHKGQKFVKLRFCHSA